MNYDEFKTHLTNFVWRNNDTEFSSALGGLISMADSAIQRDLRIERMHSSEVLNVTTETFPLPSDYHSMRVLTAVENPIGILLYIDPSDLYKKRNQSKSNRWQGFYSLQYTNLLLVGPASEDDPIDLVVNYRSKIPDFQGTDASWLADDYLDLYTYAVLKHSGMYLREDARVQSWSALYTEAVEKLNEDSAFYQTRGVPATVPLPRMAGIQRTRSRGGKLSSW